MNNVGQALTALAIVFTAGVLVGSWVDHWPSLVSAEQAHNQSLTLQVIGHQHFGRNLMFGAYCDKERGHLMYTYTVAAGESSSGNIAVIKDGCHAEK
jgi:hypothetical protein